MSAKKLGKNHTYIFDNAILEKIVFDSTDDSNPTESILSLEIESTTSINFKLVLEESDNGTKCFLFANTILQNVSENKNSKLELKLMPRIVYAISRADNNPISGQDEVNEIKDLIVKISDRMAKDVFNQIDKLLKKFLPLVSTQSSIHRK